MNKDIQLQIEELFKKLKEKGLTISSCESYTGGGFANSLTNVAGSSEFFKGALVTYSNEAKIKVAKIKKRIIKKYGAVSQECAEGMASNARKIMNTDIAVSFTGNADKDVMENKPPFSGFITINYQDLVKSYKLDLGLNKNMTRNKFKDESILFAIKKSLELF